jgi:hypothetical protein
MPKQNLKHKAAFFALYYGQEVLRWNQWHDHVPNGIVSMMTPMSKPGIVDEGWFLELRDLRHITDEEVLEIAKMVSGNESEKIISRDEHRVLATCGKDEIGVWFDGEILLSENEQYPLLVLQVYDYLRSLGFLIPFLNYTTDQIIEMKWAEYTNSGEDEGPWETSLVKCDLCSHEWVAVRPAGLEKLECPDCSNLAGFENIKSE